MPTCNCWVSLQHEHLQFMLRYGAHNTQCPRFRLSSDPVDQMKDKIDRMFGEATPE